MFVFAEVFSTSAIGVFLKTNERRNVKLEKFLNLGSNVFTVLARACLESRELRSMESSKATVDFDRWLLLRFVPKKVIGIEVSHPPKSGKSMRFGEGLRRPRRKQSPFRNEENVATSGGSCMRQQLRLVAAV